MWTRRLESDMARDTHVGMGYVKLHSDILESTIWCTDHATRIVWITMLAMADKNGEVMGSVPGLAKRAQATVDETERALTTLSAPDGYSRTRDNEGRRITTIEGGWSILNFAKHRERGSREERRERDAERQQRNRDRRRREATNPNLSATPSGGGGGGGGGVRPVPHPVCTKTPSEGSEPESQQGGEQGPDEQPNLFALLAGTRIRDNTKNRRAVLSSMATHLQAEGLTAEAFVILRRASQQQADTKPDGLLSHWLQDGRWRTKLIELGG